MLSAWEALGAGLRNPYDRGGPFLPGPDPPDILLPLLQRGPGGRVTGGPSTGLVWRVPGRAEGPPPPPPPHPIPPPRRGQDAPDVVPTGSMQHGMPGGRLTREGNKPQRALGTFLSPPCVVHGSGPGGG